jgi:F-type H+-transporting ATPase subunit gamma
MASLLEIKKKINGVKNTRKITKAMQLVAASKMQYFQKKALSSRKYTLELLDLLKINLIHKAKSVYTEKREEGPTLFVIYTSDKGLCGPLNSKILNALFKSPDWINTPDKDKLLLTIGKKSTDFAKHNKINTI